MLLIPVLMNPGPGAKGKKGASVAKKKRGRSLVGRPRNSRGRLLAKGAAPRNSLTGRKLTVAEALAGRIIVPGHVTQSMIDQADAIAHAQRRAFGLAKGKGRKKKGVSRPKNVSRRATQVAAIVREQIAHKARQTRRREAQRSHNAARSRGMAAAKRVAKKRAAARAKKAANATKRRRAADKRRLGGIAASDKWRSSKARSGRRRGYTRGRSYTKGTSYASRPETITFTEAAYRSGAVYPAKYPAGHPRAGQRHPKAGRAMTFADALQYEVPVVGYLSRDMIKGMYDRLPRTATGAINKRDRKGVKAAKAYLETMRRGGVRLKDGTYIPGGGYRKLSASRLKGAKRVSGLSEQRRRDGSAWRRAPVYHSRSGRTPSGQVYRKGTRKPDYKQSWSTKPAKWQHGGGEHLHVKFRKGRGPVYRAPMVLGFGPSQREVDTIQLGGFGGPVDSPGGRVKLNGRRRRRGRKSAGPRNSKGRFLRRAKKNGKRRAKRRAKANGRRRKHRRNKRSITAKVFNNGRRRRKHRRVKANGRRRRRSRRNTGLVTKANGKRRYKRRRRSRRGSANLALKLNGRRRRRHKANGRRRRHARRNPGFGGLKLQLDTLMSKGFAMRVVQATAGMAGTMLLSDALMNVGPIRRLAYMQGLAGTAARFGLCLGSAALLSAGAYAARNVKFVGADAWQNILVGGAVYGLVNGLYELGVGGRYLPKFGARMPAAGGVNDWMELSGLRGGMGAVFSAADLVAGESAAQPFQMGGLGSGGVPIPIEDLRGYPGQYGGGLQGTVNDWVELQPDAAVDRDAVGAAGESF